MLPRIEYLRIIQGFLMGGADIIPGVSGGTMALILGVYERLVAALSRFDLALLSLVRRKHWREAAAHVDFVFLLTLGSGIAMGILALGGLMHYLLEHHREPTFAAFFGLILASVWLVAGMIDRWGAGFYVLMGAAAAGAYLLVGLPAVASPPPTLWYVFACSMVSICAMILPGISGAFVLLVLGAYEPVTGALRQLQHGVVTAEVLLTITVFVTGATIGLLSFSKVLRWLLVRYEAQTLAVLCGIMLGSLRKIWPFKQDLTPHVAEFRRKRFENVLPDAAEEHVWLALGVMLAAGALVIVLDRVSSAIQRKSEASQRRR